MVLGIVGRVLECFLQMLAGLGFAADAERPAGGVEVEQAEAAVGAGMVELGVELEREIKFLLHFVDDFQRAPGFGAREFAKVHREIVMRGGVVGVELNEFSAGGDALLGDVGAFGIAGGVIGPVKGGADELEAGVGVVGVGEVVCLRGGERFFRAAGKLRVRGCFGVGRTGAALGLGKASEQKN